MGLPFCGGEWGVRAGRSSSRVAADTPRPRAAGSPRRGQPRCRQRSAGSSVPGPRPQSRVPCSQQPCRGPSSDLGTSLTSDPGQTVQLCLPSHPNKCSTASSPPHRRRACVNNSKVAETGNPATVSRTWKQHVECTACAVRLAPSLSRGSEAPSGDGGIGCGPSLGRWGAPSHGSGMGGLGRESWPQAQVWSAGALASGTGGAAVPWGASVPLAPGFSAYLGPHRTWYLLPRQGSSPEGGHGHSKAAGRAPTVTHRFTQLVAPERGFRRPQKPSRGSEVGLGTLSSFPSRRGPADRFLLESS